MTSAPKSKRVVITNQEQLDQYIEELKSTASWGGIKNDKDHDQGKFYIEIEQSAEWFYSKSAHDDAVKSANTFSERGF